MSAEQPRPAGPVRLYGPQFRNDPAGLYRQIRQQYGPVAPVLLEGDIPAWFVCGYREVDQVANDPQLFTRENQRWNAWDRIPDDWPLFAYVVDNPSVMFTEGAAHRERAGAISDALAAVDQSELSVECERIADELIDEFAGSGEADLMAQYAEQIPLRATAAMFGMSAADATGLVRDIAVSVDSAGEDSMDSYERVQDAMQRLVEAKRRVPGPDVTSRLLEHPADLGDQEIVLDLLVVLSIAHQPTSNWIGNSVRLMLTDARFAATLSGGRATAGQALDEVLWEDTPTQNSIPRIATRDTQLGGQRIRARDLLVLGLAAANADPHVRRDADGAAGNRAQMSFSHGEHGCPYPAPELAEVIAKTSVEVLLDRLPDLTLAVPAGSLEWRPSVWVRGLTGLPVTFTPVPRRDRAR
jgi:cytochrome P450